MTTKRADDIVKRLIAILDGAKDTFSPKVAHVYYGDQELIPEFPAIAVEAAPKERVISATRQWEVTLRASIFVHHGKVQSSTITREETDALAEQIEDTIHQFLTLNGDVIFGFITRVDPGVSLRQDVMLRTTRMTWEGTSKEQF